MGQLRPTTGQFYHRVRAAGEERRNVYSLIKLQQDEYCKLVATASYICQLPPPLTLASVNCICVTNNPVGAKRTS